MRPEMGEIWNRCERRERTVECVCVLMARRQQPKHSQEKMAGKKSLKMESYHRVLSIVSIHSSPSLVFSTLCVKTSSFAH